MCTPPQKRLTFEHSPGIQCLGARSYDPIPQEKDAAESFAQTLG